MVFKWVSIILICSFCSCISNIPKTQVVKGETMGTTYVIKYIPPSSEKISKAQVDDLLKSINQSVSTYISNSVISLINKAQADSCKFINLDKTFLENFNSSKIIYEKTGGTFNPALMPLVNYWGFGYQNKNRNNVDSNEVKHLLNLTDFDGFQLVNNQLNKKNKSQQLDFSAIAKGFGVDQLALLLETKNIENFLVEIGGELRAKGRNEKNEYWSIAIDKPEKGLGNRQFTAILKLKNQSVATSGNYRNYRKIGDKEYGHIINPETGYPEQTDVISATIISKNCADADAYATACMVMGFKKAKKLIESSNELQAYLIYKSEGGEIAYYQSSNLNVLEIN